MTPTIFVFAISWFAGWAAGIFWIGMEKGGPKPGTGPLGRLLPGVIGGVAAVLFAVVADMADMEMPALDTIAVAAVVGAFAATLVVPFLERGERTT